jgi:hypothetical protein
MSLSYHKTEGGNFVITERILGWSTTKTTTVEYTADLLLSRCNSEPFTPTHKPARDWFNKYYRPKFTEEEV